MAQRSPDWNFLGVEIRQPLVDRANEQRDQLGLGNLHYLFGNINTALRSPTAEPRASFFPPGVLQGVTIQFPDPWFKRRHQKRRVVQPQLVDDFGSLFAVWRFFICPVRCVRGGGGYARSHFGSSRLYLKGSARSVAKTRNPMPISTERELSTIQQDQPVYRAWFWRR